MSTNTPYRKVYQNGILTNPIIGKYESGASNKSGKKVRLSNNRKGNGLVVVKIGQLSFAKYRVVKQRLKDRIVVQSVLINK